MKIFHCHVSSKSTFFKRSCQESPGIVCWWTHLSFSAQRCPSGDVYLSLSFNSCTGSSRFAQDTWGFLARTVWTSHTTVSKRSMYDPFMSYLPTFSTKKIDRIHVYREQMLKNTYQFYVTPIFPMEIGTSGRFFKLLSYSTRPVMVGLEDHPATTRDVNVSGVNWRF